MGEFDVRKNQYRKVTGIAEREIGDEFQEPLTAIIKVNVEDYVPRDVRLRNRIDGKLFTAEFEKEALEELERDKSVDSVAISGQLDIPD